MPPPTSSTLNPASIPVNSEDSTTVHHGTDRNRVEVAGVNAARTLDEAGAIRSKIQLVSLRNMKFTVFNLLLLVHIDYVALESQGVLA